VVSSEPLLAEGKEVCTYCGGKLMPGGDFCPECGRIQGETSP